MWDFGVNLFCLQWYEVKQKNVKKKRETGKDKNHLPFLLFQNRFEKNLL